MTIRHLKIFIAVAETGSMSGAAQKLYLSQPTVSQAIQELERHYQIHLFERLSRKLFITGEGRQLLSLATQAVSQFDSLEATMQERRRVSSLRLGSSITVGTCLIPSVIQELEQQFTDIQIFSVASNTREIEQKLLLSQLDAAVVEGNIESPDLVCIPVIHDRLVLCCAASHEFYRRDVIRAPWLEGQKFAMREPGSGTRRLFEQYLHARGIRVILDGVYSHTGSNSLYFNREGAFPSVGAYNSKGIPPTTAGTPSTTGQTSIIPGGTLALCPR